MPSLDSLAPGRVRAAGADRARVLRGRPDAGGDRPRVRPVAAQGPAPARPGPGRRASSTSGSRRRPGCTSTSSASCGSASASPRRSWRRPARTRRPSARRSPASAARYLERRLGDGVVVAVSHGRDTGEVPRFFGPGRRIDATFVSAMGGSPLVDSPTNPNEIARRLADRCGGRAKGLYAPAYVESAGCATSSSRQEAVARHARAPRPGRRRARRDRRHGRRAARWSGAAASRSRRSAGCATPGAVGDVLGNYVDVDGRRLDSPETARLVGLALDDLRGDRHRRRRRQRGREAVRDPRRPPDGRRRRPRRRRGQRARVLRGWRANRVCVP